MEKDEGAWAIHPTYSQIQTVLDTLNAGVLVRTVEGRVLFANDRLLQWVGYSAAEMDGREVRTLIPDELHDELDSELQEIHSGDERLRIGIMKRKDGRTLPIITCPHVLRNEDRTVAVVAVILDLGEVQTARRLDHAPPTGLAAGLQRIATELHSLSLFAGARGVAHVPHDHADIQQLSPREREILDDLVAGSRVPTIAEKLFISPHTVRNHLKSMYRKLDVPNQAALIERIRRLGS